MIQHTPCFGIYGLRGTFCSAQKMVSVPMIYKDHLLQYDHEGLMNAITDKITGYRHR
ncbi:MAG: hypothetical protein U0Z26_02905 [Anaerolineales bacterium]